MKLAAAVWPRLTDRIKPVFLRKMLPMTAGVSNVLLDGTWIARYGKGQILDYYRGVSMGPLMPLVITPTTLDQHMNVAVSYRTTAFSPDRIEGIMHAFLEQIENPTRQAKLLRQPRNADSAAA